MTKLAIFASGSGSNFEALVHAIRHNHWPIEVACLICDQPDAYAQVRAAALNIPCHLFVLREYDSKEAYETAILTVLQSYDVSFVALAGYMKIIGPTLLAAYEGRMINIHPSLLPLFPGNSAIADALAAGVTQTGVTVHYVDSGIDTGAVIAQRVVPVEAADTLACLQMRIHAVEHQLYPEVLYQLLVKEQIS